MELPSDVCRVMGRARTAGFALSCAPGVGRLLQVLVAAVPHGGGARWDLIFADAQGGKWEGLDDTIDALAPHGVLLVDDMQAAAN